MTKCRFLIVPAALLIIAAPAMAQPGRGGGGGMGNMGGNSFGHMSTEGRANTNGPFATDRDRGAERANDRRSAEGLAHNNQAHGKHKHHHKHSH